MLKYVTWKPKQVNNLLIEHPNTNDRVNKETNGQIIFNETPYQIADGRYISWLEHSGNITQEQLDNWRILDPAFEFTIIDEIEANLLLSELGENNGNQLISVTNFIFTDNRPVDNI